MPRTNHGDHGTKYCNFTYHYNHDYDINVSNMENVEDLQESFQFQRLSMDPNFHAARERSVWHKLRWYYKDTIRPHLTRRFFAIIISGQFLSLVLCMTGVAGQKLVIACGVQIPAFQSFCNYMLLSMVFTTKFVMDTEEAKMVVKTRWWMYIIIAAIDVYANYSMFKAYQYTSLTSVQLLDSLTVPCLVILSIIVLKAKYKAVHFIGVLICLGGIGLMVWADFTSCSQGPQPGNHHSELLGDLLAIAGACSYAFSNIAGEFVVKTSTITEFLGMLSFFACFFSGINVIIFERNHLGNIVWDFETMLYLSLSVLSQFALYILMPLLMRYSSATMVTLMLLTADIFSLFAGIYLFNYTFSAMYVVSFSIIILGVVIFKIFPTPSQVDRFEERESGINDASSSNGSQDSLTQPLI